MTDKVRLISPDELPQLLTLYAYLNPDDPKLTINQDLRELWDEIIRNPSLYYFVIEEDGFLVSSCTMAIIPNLTRSARPYALIENVVTHPHYRKKGYGTAILHRAIAVAREKNCYKVMLMTSRKEENTLRFYEKAGFHAGEKTAFVVRL